MIGRPRVKEPLKRETVRFGKEFAELKALSAKGEFGENVRQALRNFIKVLKRRK